MRLDPDNARRYPATRQEAFTLLARLGASRTLVRHVELVGEAADAIVDSLSSLGIEVDRTFVEVGVVLHDAGKVQHPDELSRPGSEHEGAGEQFLLREGVDKEIARVCVTHARWESGDLTLEELLIALADKLWKGVRTRELEERVIARVSLDLGRDYWECFLSLDSLFEAVADGGDERLRRSRV